MTGIIVKSRIKEIIRKADTEGIINNVAEEVEEALEFKVEEIIGEGVKRAKANQRKTLLARDL